MSDTNAPEPTMEEILASIRRIISEDEAPAPAAEASATPPGDPPSPAAEAAEPETHKDVLELTDRVEAAPAPEPEAKPAPAPPPRPAAASLGDLDFASDDPPEPAAAARPEPARSESARPEPARPSPPAAARSAPTSDETLVSHQAADRASDMFGALTSSLAMPASGRTLEDVVRELLKPMLKDWLDHNLPVIVEQRVQDEVERISRRRTY